MLPLISSLHWLRLGLQNKRSATLISLMLSSQTKDEVTDVVVDKLRAAFGGTLGLKALLAAEEHVIANCINKVGFWRRKTQSVPSDCYCRQFSY